MFNLIKMNLYRMSRAVSTWVMAIVAVLFGIMQFSSLKLMLDDPLNMFDGSGTQMLGYTVLNGVRTVATFLQNSNVLIILAIFVVMFTNAEHKCGFDKNIIGITKHKWKQTLARWISAVIGMTALIILGYSVMLGLSALFIDNFAFGSVAAMFKALGLMYLSAVTFSAIFFFFTTLFNNSVGGVVSSLIISLGILNLFELILDLLVKKIVSDPKVLPTDFFYDAVFINFNLEDLAVKTTMIFVVTSVIYIVLALGGSMMLQQRRDVK
ncbi:MAG: hypothetical protein K6E26_01680 [Clostridiales bacterium]|nr:hypothetical protein [Clostridiales bacterium]MBR6254910.1 hypothetical protein [Clostridiales bacterium]MCR5274047.1 hypothetical protein [Clostridiales bacterium]